MSHRPTILTASVLLSLLALTRCGGGSGDPTQPDPGAGDPADDGSSSAVYEFTREPPGMLTSLTVAIPDDLREAAGPDAEGLLVDSVTLTPHELDGVKHCAVNVAIEWADGALELANKPATSQADADAEIEKWTNSFLDYFDVETTEEWIELAERAQGGDAQAGQTIAEGMEAAEQSHPYAANATRELREQGLAFEPRLFIEKMQELIAADANKPVDEAAEESEEANVAREGLGIRSSVYPLADLNESAPETGLYLAPDFASGINVGSCAANPTDDDATETFTFRTSQDGEGADFAEFDYTVLSDGSITVVEAEVEDYERDVNGDWIAK